MVRVKNRHSAAVCGVLPGDVGLVSERDANILRRYLAPVEPPSPPAVETEAAPSFEAALDEVVTEDAAILTALAHDQPHKPRKRRT